MIKVKSNEGSVKSKISGTPAEIMADLRCIVLTVVNQIKEETDIPLNILISALKDNILNPTDE